MCFAFNFVIFHHCANAAILWHDSVFTVVPNLISGTMSSVDCSKNITGKFFKECNLCFSLMWRLIWVQNKLIIIIVVWKQCTCQILLMDKALQNCLHVLQCNHRFRSLLSFWATTPWQSFPLSLLFVRHMHAPTPTPLPQNPWLSHFLTLWPPHLEQSLPRHQALCYSLFLQKQTQDIPLLRIFQLSNIVHHPDQSVHSEWVSGWVGECVHASFA